MVLILLWKMVKFMGRSAFVITLKVAITLPKFLWRTAHPTISTNFIRRPSVRYATVAQTEYAERSFHSNRFHNRCILGPWRRDVEYFGRFLRWCRLVNAIIKKKKIICNDNKDSWQRKELISENRRVILAVCIIEK